MLRIIDVEYIKNNELLLTFNDGIKKVVDFAPVLIGEVFSELREKYMFIQFGLVHGTIEWYNGVDFAPEYLYEIGKTVD